MGFVDLQVNGYGGVDFNADDVSADALHGVCERLRSDGVDGFLPTIITEEIDVMARRLARIVEIRRSDPLVAELVWGMHIEGPFISPESGYVGAHPPQTVRPAAVELMKQLLDAADGLTRIVTLAPEYDEGHRVTRFLADQGITVAAGHCDPSVDELRAAIDAGLRMFTHLGNGCPMQMHRHDNVVQRVLSVADKLWLSFIADGAHVPYPALGNYLRCAGLQKCVVVTDAMSAAGLGPGQYTLGRMTVDIGDDLVVWSPDRTHFVGSASTMPRMADNLREHLKLSDEEIERLTSTGPREILGMT